MSPKQLTRKAEGGSAQTLAERVYQALKRDIIIGAFPPGAALSEKELAGKYDSSRTPVREAAVRLHQDNLLEIIPNRGYFVTHITVVSINEMYEYRAAVETVAADLAASKPPDSSLLDGLAGLARVEYRTDDRASYMQFVEADTRFHVGIARLSRNPLLVRAVSEMRNHMERIMYAAIDIGYYGEFPVREHLDILEAIKKRQPEQARQLMHDHIFGSKDKVLQIAGSSSRL